MMAKDNSKNAFDEMEGEETPVFEIDANNPAAFSVNMGAVTSFDEDPDAASDIDAKDEDKPTIIENEIEEDEDTPDIPDTTETSTDDEEDEENEESDEEDEGSGEDEGSDDENDSSLDYDDYSESALIALSEIREGNFNLKEEEIPKDLDAATLRDMYRKTSELRVNEEKDQLLRQAGEAAEFVKFLMDGGDPNAVKQALSTADLVSLDLNNEENQRKVLKSMYSQKDLPEEDVDEIVESIFDRGLGLERASQAQESLKKQQQKILERSREEQRRAEEAQKEAQKQFIDSVNQRIDSRDIGGYQISKQKAEELKKAMWEPTEIIEVPHPQTGEPVKMRATKTQALQQRINQDMDMYLAFNLWLLEGGSFDFVKEQAAQEADDDLRALLQRKSKKSKTRRLKSSKNAFKDMAGGW